MPMYLFQITQKEEQRSLRNPICVMTYKALPKIYGKKRDSARAKT